jgi:hypothetical protein
MNFENASTGPGASRRFKPSKPRKRSNLAVAIRNHQAEIARKGFASPLDKIVQDSAIATSIAEIKMKIARSR